MHKSLWLHLFLFTNCLLAPVCAQTTAPELTATPARLTIVGQPNTKETRNVLLSTTSGVSNLKIIALDVPRTDEQFVIPAAALTTNLPAANIAANDSLSLPITFDLAGAHAGEFNGEMRVQFQGGKLALPISIKVKHKWWLPLIVLLLGVSLSMILTQYRERGKLRDEVQVRVAHLRTAIREEANLAKPFRDNLDAALLDTDAALRAQKWDDASKAITQAEGIMLLWRKGRADWLRQFEYSDELLKLVAEAESRDGQNSYLTTLRRGIEDAIRNAPASKGPDELRDKLDAFAKQSRNYSEVHNQLRRMAELWAKLPPEQQDSWRQKSKQWQWHLGNLSLTDEAAYQTLRSELADGLTVLEEVEKYPLDKMEAKGGAGFTLLGLASNVPDAKALPEEDGKSAASKLKWFMWVSYGIALLMLAGAGFIELYVNKPTFGANAWGDYFGLLIWGFGAEATRASLVGLLKTWGLSAIK